MMIFSLVLQVASYAASPVVWSALFLTFSTVMYIPYLILIILSFNRDAQTFILKLSEFWIKIVYAEFIASLAVLYYHEVTQKRSLEDTPAWLGYTNQLILCIIFPLFMAFVGGVDAIPQMKYKSKVCLIGILGSVTTYMSLSRQLLVSADDDYIFEIHSTGSVISINSMLANVNGTLALLMWKQMIDIIRNKDRCVSIIYRPYLRWEMPTKESPAVVPRLSEVEEIVVESAS